MTYPRTVTEVIGDVEYPEGVLHAMKRYKKTKPWRGTPKSRQQKLRVLHEELNHATGLKTRLKFTSSLGGYHIPHLGIIVLNMDVSLLTYLHEYGHSLLGPSEYEACRWSVNLFKRIFPVSYAKLVPDGHMLRRKSE